jgi:hypothetical protein
VAFLDANASRIRASGCSTSGLENENLMSLVNFVTATRDSASHDYSNCIRPFCLGRAMILSRRDRSLRMARREDPPAERRRDALADTLSAETSFGYPVW